MPRPLIATIDIAALRHNLRVAMTAAPAAKCWAVVKANAYGHGLARAIRAFGATDGLGLIEVDGAVRLRELGWTKPILLLEGFFQPDDIAVMLQHNIQTAIHCTEQIDMLAAAGLTQSITRPLDIHLKVNSGMNRLGFVPAALRHAYERLRGMAGIGQITLMTHFANADDPQNARLTLAEQKRRFDEAVAGLDAPYCLSNSAATLNNPELACAAIRPGIMLYGGTPGGKSAGEFGLLPGMTLSSELIGIQELQVGDAVGYGSRFVASQPMRIGVIACGYADGYPRHAATGAPVLVDGVRCEMVGRVSMDMMTVDLTPVPYARIGSKVILWGEGLPIDEVAAAAGTIGYELMCAVAPRVQVQERVQED
jgi:alanine racemase